MYGRIEWLLERVWVDGTDVDLEKNLRNIGNIGVDLGRICQGARIQHYGMELEKKYELGKELG